MKLAINSPFIENEEISAVASILKKGALTSSLNEGGKMVQEFEKLASSFVKSKYAIAVNSGTAALQAALYAFDIKQGDEVIIPSFTFVATANAVISTGAKPVFADILKENYTIDPEDIMKKITKKTKMIIPVHLYGHIAFLDRISEIAKKNNLIVVEDSAQALGSTFKDKHAGTFFDLGCYSMYPGKVITAGEGGFIVTNNKKLRDKLLMIRNHGMLHENDTRMFGLNLRLPEISATIASIQIKKLPKFLEIRKKNAKLLSQLISDLKIKVPIQRKFEQVNWYLYTITTEKRNYILKKLNQKNIQAKSYYSIPIHKTPFYKQKNRLPITEWASSKVVSLPIHPKLSSKNIEFIAKSLRELLHE